MEELGFIGDEFHLMRDDEGFLTVMFSGEVSIGTVTALGKERGKAMSEKDIRYISRMARFIDESR